MNAGYIQPATKLKHILSKTKWGKAGRTGCFNITEIQVFRLKPASLFIMKFSPQRKRIWLKQNTTYPG